MVDSIARSQGNVVVAATLNRSLRPSGFERIGRNEPIVIKGFSTDTAVQLFQPITNVIDAQNALLEQRIFNRLQEEPERVDAKTVASRFRTRERNENPALRRTPDQVLEDLRIRFGITSEGSRTDFASVSERPSFSELFGASSGETGSNNLSSGFTSDTGLSPLQNSRVAIAKEATLDISDLSLGTSSSTPERILVRLDSSERGSEDELGVAQGKLLLNGTELQNGVVHSLTVAEYNSLQYVARDIEALDYLSVIGVDDTNQTRGEPVTTAISTSASGVERFLRDGLERFEFIAKTEAGIPVPRVSIDFEGTFVNGDILSDINAGLIEVSVNQFGNLDNEGTNLLLQSSGNTLDVTFGSSPPLDGVVVNIKALDDSVDISDIQVKLG